MNQFATWIFFAVLSVITQQALSIADLDKPRKHCTLERVHKMLGYNCAKLELREFPKNLKSSTEVLDVSQNKIRELTRDSFFSMTDLRFLYLFDNNIVFIEDDTFAGLVNLEALDLSRNAMKQVPPEIFNLPMLRNLYLAENTLDERNFDTLEKVSKPIKAPLRILDISKNRLFKIPDFGILPDLLKLNLSSNFMRELTPQQFSPFCNLKQIDLNSTSMEKCRCDEVTRFLLKKREAELDPYIYCDVVSSECKIDVNTSFTETQDYSTCMSIRKAVIEHEKAQLTWGIVAVSVAGFLVFFIGCLYCLHRRNVRQMNRKGKINNQNVKTVKVQQMDPTSPIDEIVTSPEKLLIKRSDV